MKEMIVSALKSKAGLTDEQANKAADVVMEIVQAKGGDMMKSIPTGAGALGGLGGLGGLLGDEK